MVSKSLKEVKGRRGPVRHREEPAEAAGRRRVDASHLGVQERLQVTALPPQQGGHVPGGGTITCELPTANQPSHPHRDSVVRVWRKSYNAKQPRQPKLPGGGERSLSAQQGAGFQQVAAERRVLAGDHRGRCRALQVQTADHDVEDGRQGRQLDAVKRGRQLRAEGFYVAVRQGGHGGHDAFAVPPTCVSDWSRVKGRPADHQALQETGGVRGGATRLLWDVTDCTLTSFTTGNWL